MTRPISFLLSTVIYTGCATVPSEHQSAYIPALSSFHKERLHNMGCGAPYTLEVVQGVASKTLYYSHITGFTLHYSTGGLLPEITHNDSNADGLFESTTLDDTVFDRTPGSIRLQRFPTNELRFFLVNFPTGIDCKPGAVLQKGLRDLNTTSPDSMREEFSAR